MPLVGEGNDIHIEYTMPEYIKNLITDDFLKEFRNQLFRIHEHYSLDLFAEEGIPINTSTAGWFAAFGKACLLTHKEPVLDYWRTFPWYDSDIFDGELAEMLIERHFILGDLSKVIEEQLGIKESDLRVCNECGKLYSKDMVVEITDTDEEELISKYRCLYCQDVKDLKDGDPHATDYYRSILKELDEYKETHPIKNEEE
ncbi:MAG: hypothetical protein HDR13_00735 [Lachnospiraceae bacterium]|nr:hypothetical protein [Lachnospiraceae bacterium]